MDVSKRAFSGSVRTKGFYGQQQRQWEELVLKCLPDQSAVEEELQLFHEALLPLLIAGEGELGKRALPPGARQKGENALS